MKIRSNLPFYIYSDTNKKGNDPETRSEKLTKSDRVQELGKLDQTQRISNRQNKVTFPRSTDFYGKYSNKQYK